MAPSLDTIRKRIKDIVGEPLQRCGFSDERLDNALPHFHKLNYKSDVFLLVNDATALLPALGYNVTTDEVIGFALTDEELPRLDVRAGESLEAFLQRFQECKLATQVEIYMLVPLTPHTPPYILAAFAQSGPQSGETAQQRLRTVQTEMERRGALILTWAADGASAHYKVMRQLSTVAPGASAINIPNVPTLLNTGATVSLAARTTSYRGNRLQLPETPIIDPVHLANLLRNAPLRIHAAMAIGSKHVDLLRVRSWLEDTLSAAGVEVRLGVRHTDWEVVDRMNYAAAQRLFSTKLLDYIKDNAGGQFLGSCSPLRCCCACC